MLALVLAAQIVTSAVCTTPQPGPAWVCVNGGWLPPGHPGIGQTPAPPPPVPPTAINAPNPEGFAVGRYYRRDDTGTRLYIAGLNMLSNGVLVYAAECVDEAPHDLCYFKGMARFLVANGSKVGWTELTPYEYPRAYPVTPDR